MTKQIFSRLIQLILVMLLASFITFGLTYLSPSDPAEMSFSRSNIVPTKEILEKKREEMGLNRPFIIQYSSWLNKVVKGDLGYSFSNKKPVAEIIKPKLKMTFRLGGVALTLLVILSLFFGILAAITKDSWLDYIIRLFALASISVPQFWFGMLLIYYFVVKFRLLKITNPYSPTGVILPALTLAIPLAGKYIRLVRTFVLEEFNKDYVKGANSRGLGEYRIIFGHILPNALRGLITLLGLSIAILLGGTVIVERLFSWPGIGSMAMESITLRDYAILQAYVMFMTVSFVGINFLVDIITTLLDPKNTVKGEN